MTTEVKEKIEVVNIRLEIPKPVYDRVVKSQARLIGRRGEKVTLPETCVDILDKATRSMK